MLRSLLMVSSIALFTAPAASARAYGPHDLGRWIGIGYSDGYHARTGCPPKHSCSPRPPVASYPATWSYRQPAASGKIVR